MMQVIALLKQDNNSNNIIETLTLKIAIQNGSVLGCDYVIANKIRTKMMKQMDHIFESVDLIATPTTAIGTIKVAESDHQCT